MISRTSNWRIVHLSLYQHKFRLVKQMAVLVVRERAIHTPHHTGTAIKTTHRVPLAVPARQASRAPRCPHLSEDAVEERPLDLPLGTDDTGRGPTDADGLLRIAARHELRMLVPRGGRMTVLLQNTMMRKKKKDIT